MIICVGAGIEPTLSNPCISTGAQTTVANRLSAYVYVSICFVPGQCTLFDFKSTSGYQISTNRRNGWKPFEGRC